MDRRLKTLRTEIAELDVRRAELVHERDEIELAMSRERHPCACVRLNGDIEIYEMAEQERRGRVALGIGGWVSKTLSALKACPACAGTGVPVKGGGN